MPTFAPPHNRILRVCVTTVAVGRAFPQKAERLRRSLARHDPRLTFAPFINHYPKGTPTTKETTYAFKPLAIQQRLNEGYDTVIWIDSAFVATGPIRPVVSIAQKHNHVVLLDPGWNLRQWSSDKQLEAFGLSRSEAERIPIPLAGVCAFTKESELLRQWVSHIDLFPGPRRNPKSSCTRDPKCLGTRHDQTVLGILMHVGVHKYTTLTGIASMTETSVSQRGILHHHPTWPTL